MQSFGKIYWLFFDLWTPFHVNTTWAKVSISNPNANLNLNLCSSYTSLILCLILEVLEELFLFISIYLFIFDSCVPKGLWICVQSFEKIFWPVSDLLASRQIDTGQRIHKRSRCNMIKKCLLQSEEKSISDIIKHVLRTFYNFYCLSNWVIPYGYTNYWQKYL